MHGTICKLTLQSLFGGPSGDFALIDYSHEVSQVSALGTEVVVDGCLAEGASLAWNRLVAALP